MIHIHRTTKSDILEKLPNLGSFAHCTLEARSPTSLLICTAGFEDRATAIADAIAGCKISSLLILRYPTNVHENERSLGQLRRIDADRNTEIIYERGDFRRSFKTALDQLLQGLNENVIVDISVMSSYLTYRVFDALIEHRMSPNIGIFYAEAEHYFPQRSEWEQVHAKARKAKDLMKKANLYEGTNFQSQGVDAIYESESFPGRNLSSLPTQVVAIPNFSRARMREMLAFAESHYNSSVDQAIWVIGQPPDEDKNGWRFEALRELYAPADTVYGVSTLDYKQILWHLVDLWENVGLDRHIMIASLGSKMQHLGVFLFLKMRPDTGLLLSEPRSFAASRFSSGIGPMWWMDFGLASSLKGLLSSYGMLDFRWE